MNVVTHEEMLVADNVDRIINGYDVIIDGTDTFETRYLLNDAAVAKSIPVIHASVFRFEGQLTTFIPYEGPCYRCLYPTPPPPELAPGCSVAGVLGVVPGIMGMLQANEALKVLLGIGDTLAGRLLLFDALDTTFTELKLRRDPACPVCSTEAVAARAEGRPLPIPSFGGSPAADERAVRPRRAERVSTVWIPQVLRAQAGGNKQLELAGGSVGEVVDDARRAVPVAPRPAPDRRTATLNRFVNVYVNGQDVRYLEGLATPVGGARRGPAPAGDGGRGRLTMGALRARELRGVAAAASEPIDADHVHAHAHEALAPHGGRYDDILDAIGHTPLVEIPRMSPQPGGPDLRQARDGEPDRLGQGPRREVPRRGPRGARPARGRTRSSSSRRRATPASPSR